MIKSMTGFGKATLELENKNIFVEVRSLNSKGADIGLRISSSFRNYELELRNEIIKLLERGKIDVSIYVESKVAETPVAINIALAKSYQEQLKNLAKELGEPLVGSLSHILKLPDVLKNERKEVDENEWKNIKTCVLEAISDLQTFRNREGESIKIDLKERLNKIKSFLEKIKEMDVKRIPLIKEKIKNNLNEIIGKDKYDQNRLEQELVYYIEKLDLNEEKVRLKTHLDFFAATIDAPSAGRKLNFITQEIGREINTIGSKANDAEIQKLVVLMKDELEKIKEQTNNIL